MQKCPQKHCTVTDLQCTIVLIWQLGAEPYDRAVPHGGVPRPRSIRGGHTASQPVLSCDQHTGQAGVREALHALPLYALPLTVIISDNDSHPDHDPQRTHHPTRALSHSIRALSGRSLSRREQVGVRVRIGRCTNRADAQEAPPCPFCQTPSALLQTVLALESRLPKNHVCDLAITILATSTSQRQLLRS